MDKAQLKISKVESYPQEIQKLLSGRRPPSSGTGRPPKLAALSPTMPAIRGVPNLNLPLPHQSILPENALRVATLDCRRAYLVSLNCLPICNVAYNCGVMGLETNTIQEKRAGAPNSGRSGQFFCGPNSGFFQ